MNQIAPTTEVAVAVDPRWRHQRSNPVDQFQRGKDEMVTPARTGLDRVLRDGQTPRPFNTNGVPRTRRWTVYEGRIA